MPARIRSADELITSHRAVCEGFLGQALTKTQKATPYVQAALSLWNVLKGVDDIHTLAQRDDIREQLCAASGFSEKAKSHLASQELADALQHVLQTIADQAHDCWREEIVYRYLLTKGESLGGSMRNVTGALAGPLLAEAIMSALRDRNVAFRVQRSSSNRDKIQSIKWPRRLLLFNKTPHFIGNNIDVIFLRTSDVNRTQRQLLEKPDAFLACGELKGGIDPAGADEHWKTANSALDRIRGSFSTDVPQLFFAGAAIQAAMAEEIFEQVGDGRLAYAANLTVTAQVSDLASWLVAL